MCGITGLVNLQGYDISPSLLKAMTRAIEHRGPDGEGNWVNKNVGLGHRRLSILDLSDNAKQPMASSDGNLIRSYNGEIYNFQELRAELQQFGYKFSSSSDTEVLLYAFHKWGVNSFFNLMECLLCVFMINLQISSSLPEIAMELSLYIIHMKTIYLDLHQNIKLFLQVNYSSHS